MFRLKDDLWPVLVFEFQGSQSLEEHRRSLQLWDELFTRGEKIIVLRIFHDELSLVHPEGAAKSTKAWLRHGASDAIEKYVAAMINVVPGAAYEEMKDKSVESVFGVPGGVFKSARDAVVWFNACVGPEIDMQIDPGPFEAGCGA